MRSSDELSASPGIHLEADLMPETPNPNTPTSFFEALYTHFIPRDFIGKIVPGGMFLYLVWFTVGSDPSLSFIKDVSGLVIAGLAGLCWIIALPLQQFAIFVARVLFRIQFLDSATTIKFRRVATSFERAKYERFVISKEAAGNTGSAIFLGCSIWVFIELFRLNQPYRASYYNPEGIIVISVLLMAFAYSLLRSQVSSLKRQADYVEKVIQYVESHQLTGSTSSSHKLPTLEE